MAQSTTKIIHYTVRQGDSLERIALNYMGDASQWIQLAILNNLDYPYLSDDLTFVKNVKATGIVTFRRTPSTVGAITIPIGSLVTAPATATAPARSYTTDATVILPNGQDTVDQSVTAVVFGEAGSCPALSVTTLGFSVANLAGVNNAAPITGGVILNVLLPGDRLLVYTDAAGAAATTGVDTQSLQGDADSFYRALLGVDIGLDRFGDLQANSRGGLALVAGMDNLREAVRHRLEINLGWYAYYPSYGTGIGNAIGQRGDADWLQFCAVEVQRTLRTDPRVADVANVQVAFTSGTVTLRCDVTAIGESSAQNLVVQLRGV